MQQTVCEAGPGVLSSIDPPVSRSSAIPYLQWNDHLTHGSAIFMQPYGQLPGVQLAPPAPGALMSKVIGASPAEFRIPPISDYMLIGRLSARSEVRYDIGRGIRGCDIRYGHTLLYAAARQSRWWLSRPEQTVLLSIPEQMLQRAWEHDRKELWPGMAEMHSFKQDAQVIQILAILMRELDLSGSINKAYTSSLMFQLSTHLVRQYSNSVDLAVRPFGMSPSRLNKVLEYVAEQLEREFGLADMARVAGISPYYFCREFKKVMGVTPHGYVTQQRIERAQALLKNTAMSITAIGAQLLFPTPSHFTATFRRLVGLTPSVFRLRCNPTIQMAME